MIPTKDPKIELVLIDEIRRDHALNYREEASYELRPLIDDIALKGLMNAVRLERLEDGNLVPVQGFRRLDSLHFLAHNVDPDTGEPYIDPTTGKPFQKVKAHIYTNLTQAQRLALKFDHGQVRNLNKVEFARAIWDAFDANVSDKEVVKMGRGLFEVYYPSKKEIEDTDVARLNYWKGALQPLKQVWQGPRVLREAYENKLRGVTHWPRKGELNELVKIFQNALSTDKTNSINRDNPGTEFMTRFNAISQENAEAVEAGIRTKQSAMMNRAQVDKTKTVTDSRILKTMIDFVLQVIPIERYAALDRMLVELERRLTTDENEILAVVIGVPAPTDNGSTTVESTVNEEVAA